MSYEVDTPYTPSIDHHMTFGDLVRMLSWLSRDAILDIGCGTDTELFLESDYSTAWNIRISANHSHAGVKSPMTVGKFLDFLMESRGTKIKRTVGDSIRVNFDAEYLVNDACYVFIGDDNYGAINGIRMNSDGTYLVSREHPYA